MTAKRFLQMVGAILCLGAAALLWTGCAAFPASPSVDGKPHPVVGTWEYPYEMMLHRREFTADGKCIMYRGRKMVGPDGQLMEYPDNGESMAICDYYVLDGRRVFVYRQGTRGRDRVVYEVLADGRLNCEDKYIARRLR
jgi:hypothetical protein